MDDYEAWRRYYSTTLLEDRGLQIIGEASNGLEAVQRARELHPDLILLDIGLPRLNGIDAARQIQGVSPASKILFVSENRSPDIAEEALSTGAGGYVVKSDVGRELLSAVDAVLSGKRFVSARLFGQTSSESITEHAAAILRSHEVAFYADDRSLVDGYAHFVESSLMRGNAVIVVVTDSHRATLSPIFEADGVDVHAAMEQGRYISLDTAEALSRLTINDMPDPVRCTEVIGDLITRAAKGIKTAEGRVAVCGEIAPTLLSKGNAEGAILLEHLWDEITKAYGVHTLCGYPSNAFSHHEGNTVFQRICAEHSAVHRGDLCGWVNV